MPVSRRTMLKGTAGLAALGLLPASARAETFPSRDITYIIPYNPGGMSDNISRVIGEKLGPIAGVTIVNDYKPGAGGAIGANFYVATKPDGYMVLQSTNSFFGIIPHVTKVDYDPMTDFIPLGVVGFAPMVIAMNPSVGVKTLDELIAKAKAEPNAIAYGSAGKGTVGHLCGAWLGEKTGTGLLHVPYKGAPEALQACMSNETQLFFGPEAIEPIRSGQLVGLGVIGDTKATTMPELLTTQEMGIEGWAPRSWHTITLLAATPPELRDWWTAAVAEILAMPDVSERITNLGLYPVQRTSEEAMQLAREDYEQFGAMLKELG